jgi:hypothetical protein
MENQEIKKAELINDLIAVSTVMDELWSYHPNNPNKKDIEEEYAVLDNIKHGIEQELHKLN